jgi:hypothetical protein
VLASYLGFEKKIDLLINLFDSKEGRALLIDYRTTIEAKLGIPNKAI